MIGRFAGEDDDSITWILDIDDFKLILKSSIGMMRKMILLEEGMYIRFGNIEFNFKLLIFYEISR